ncbi:MAG TPA: ferritin-like domain-containing protein [Actinocatenispora sp.]
MNRAQQRLQAALAAEHAAVYGYDVLGPHLAGDEQRQARAADEAHRDRRDALTVELTRLRATPSPAAPAYALPTKVTDRDSALKLAVTLEERTAAVWGAALGDLRAAGRKRALDAVTDCSVRAVRWRRLAGVAPATVAFPGGS